MIGPLKVLFGAAEVSPLAKVGGLADVAGSLPAALRKMGHDVRVVMPGYSTIDRNKYPAKPLKEMAAPFLGRTEPVAISETALPNGVPVYLLENQHYYDRKAVYSEPDDLERFLLFSLAIPELPGAVGWQPDVVHCHDWHAAGAISQIKTARSPSFKASATVITIHNMAFQGWFDQGFAARAGIERWVPSDNPMRQYLSSLLGSAIYHSDYISTVSQTYAREILTPEYGEKLDTLLRFKKERLVGIVNGLDYDEFNPATDRFLATNYDASNPKGKAANKAALQKKFGLPASPDLPLIGMVGRMTEQKGLDIATEALADLLKNENIQVVVLGTGQPKYEEMVRQLAAEHPSRMSVVIGFDAPLGQLIYGGADMFLMPSRFEPCGLGQLISFRYGTVPIVRRTGGLNDTVADLNQDLSSGTGFVFELYQSQALLAAMRRALAAFRTNRKGWQALVARVMRQDLSWDASATKYEAMYRQALDYVARTR
ncbi:MAG: glycogen/starch synthase [Dehalococcoidia bacterium]|nr:glycogen/starch synthase [Dehalococcoidia bacterium]